MRSIWLILFLLGCSAALSQQLAPHRQLFRGWLSDAKCARGRASVGIYTGTGPRCAKECVSKGIKTALILPEEKAILEISNQDATRKNVGDYVEISGVRDWNAKTLHVDSLKLLQEGVAACARPKLNQ